MKCILRIIIIGIIFLIPGMCLSEQILDITVEPVQEPGAEESVTIRYTVRNNSDHDVKLLKWGTPLEGFKTDLFKITRDSTTDATYIGRRVSRLRPDPDEDYETIPAKSAISIELPLDAGYDLRMDGNHTAVLRKINVRGEILGASPDTTKAVTRSARLTSRATQEPAATAPPKDLPVVQPVLPGAPHEFIVEAPSPPAQQSLPIRTLQPTDAKVSRDKIEFKRKAPQTLPPDQFRKFQVPRIQKIRDDRYLPLLPRTVSTDVLVRPADYNPTPSYYDTTLDPSQQEIVARAFRAAHRMAAEAKVMLEGPEEIVQASERFKLWFGSPDNLSKARGTFEKIFQHFFKQKIYFQPGNYCAKSDAGYVNANARIAYRFKRMYDPEGDDIYLCPSFWGIPADRHETSQAGVVLHEMSHLADDTVVDVTTTSYGKCSVAAETTDDCAVRGFTAASDRIQVEDTVRNADNYHLFAANLERLVSVVRSILDPDKGTRYLVQLRNAEGQYVQADTYSGEVRQNARAAPYTFIISDTKGDPLLKDGDQIRLYTSGKKLCTPGFFTIHKVERQSGEIIGQGDYVFLRTPKFDVLTIEKQKNFRIGFAQ